MRLFGVALTVEFSHPTNLTGPGVPKGHLGRNRLLDPDVDTCLSEEIRVLDEISIGIGKLNLRRC